MKNKKQFRLPVVGGNSLLVIFSVLCLVTFALLGLSTVLADRRLAEASGNAIENYYLADHRAEEIFALLRNGEIPEDVSVDGTTYSYSCPISEKQTLQVELQKQGNKWRVLRWQARSQAVYEEETITVWDGEPMF